MIISTTTQPGNRGEVYQLYRELMAPRALENGDQEVVVWCDDRQNPDSFHLFEIYSDASAMGAYASAPWFTEYMAKAGPLLASEPTVAMAVPAWSKGL
ncbi:MAG TPA: antibiotic biosynthesis monooxygenase [Acidimicrobiia bacterium]